MRFRGAVLPIAVGLMCAAVVPAGAQVTTATFYGIVQDQTAAPVLAAKVTLTQEATAAVRQTTSDHRGEFVFTALPVGTYTLKIEKDGFKTYVRTGLALAASQSVRQPHVLEVGTMSELVTVESVAPLVNTVSAEQRETLGSQQVQELPLSRRNVTNVLRLSSGVDVGGGSVRINGQGKSGAAITVDGTDANSNPSEGRAMEQYGGRNYIDVMSIEAVQEVQLMRGILPAEYGGAVSGQVNLIAKSGTNSWRGSLFENYRSHIFNARNPFQVSRAADGSVLPKNREVFNQFGGSLGGPVIRDRAFFFFTYEGYRESAFQRVNGDVPTAALRQRILTALPFPETKILLDTLPEPNVPVDANIGRFEGSGRRESTENHFVVKGDIQLTSAGRLTLAYTRNRPFGLDPRYNLDGANDRTYDYAQDRVTAQYTHTHGRWISETRAGYNRSDMVRLDHFFSLMDPKKPETIEWQRRVPRLGIQGIGTWGEAEVWDMEGGTGSIDQKVSREAGRQLFKFGGRYVRYWGSRTNPENPFFQFVNLADLDANIPGTVNITFGSHGPHKSRMYEFGFFAQDDFRVNSKLVLNLGLRYDFYSNDVVKPTGDVPVGVVNLSPATDLHKFDFGPARPLDRPTENDGWINLGPRLGFAFNPDAKGKMVFRGGFGIMYAPQVPALLRQSVGHPVVPFRTINSRAEALQLGLRYPMYAEDIRPIEEADVAASGRRLVFSVLDPHLQNPYTMNFQFDVQRSVGRDLMFEVGYVGVLGKKYPMHRRYNLPDRLTGVRPNPLLIPGGHYVDNSENTTYHSLQTSVRKRFSNSFSFDAHYTLGRGLSYTGGDVGVYYGTDVSENVIQDFFDLTNERQPTTGDVRHRFVGDLIYQTPELKSWAAPLRHALGGWQVSGIVTARSGQPMWVTQSCSSSYHCRPDYLGGDPVFVDWRHNEITTGCRPGVHCDVQYIDRSIFALVPANRGVAVRPGTAGKRLFRGPGAWNVDLSLAKNFKIKGESKIQFRADVFNVLNHVNFNNPVGSPNLNISSSQFGRITGAASMRAMQMGVRFQF
jgi:hypothetical protein